MHIDMCKLLTEYFHQFSFVKTRRKFIIAKLSMRIVFQKCLGALHEWLIFNIDGLCNKNICSGIGVLMINPGRVVKH